MNEEGRTHPHSAVVVEIAWRGRWLGDHVRFVLHAGGIHSRRPIALTLEAELKEGHHKSHQQSSDEDVEDSGHIA